MLILNTGSVGDDGDILGIPGGKMSSNSYSLISLKLSLGLSHVIRIVKKERNSNPIVDAFTISGRSKM